MCLTYDGFADTKGEEHLIAIIDYGAGNLRSVVNAIAKVGYEATITNDAEVILGADVVVLPGVGAARDTMNSLVEMGVDKVIHQFVSSEGRFWRYALACRFCFPPQKKRAGMSV